MWKSLFSVLGAILYQEWRKKGAKLQVDGRVSRVFYTLVSICYQKKLLIYATHIYLIIIFSFIAESFLGFRFLYDGFSAPQGILLHLKLDQRFSSRNLLQQFKNLNKTSEITSLTWRRYEQQTQQSHAWPI